MSLLCVGEALDFTFPTESYCINLASSFSYQFSFIIKTDITSINSHHLYFRE